MFSVNCVCFRNQFDWLINWLIDCMLADNAMMALKMLYRGPSSRLENLIEKIQATKEITNNGN